jgi:ketosteroid isomerase-like protein
MSVEDNVRLIQKAYADYSRGDMAALFEAFAEDIQWITPGNTELAGERQGKPEVAGFFRTLGEQWDFLAFEPREYIASGERVVVLGRYDVRSRQTGRTAASHWAMVWTIQNGKASRFQEYTDTSTLEAAAGTAAAAA